MTSSIPSRAATPAQPATDARALLASGAPREVLACLVVDDPLLLRTRTAARLAGEARLVDAERVVLRAQALCAWRAAEARDAPELGRWLDARVAEALAAVLEEDEPLDALAPFAGPLGLDPRALAAACARFERLPAEARDAFFALVLDGGDADRAARTRGLSLSELARRARVALEPFRRLTTGG